jgi:hypothetical protein
VDDDFYLYYGERKKLGMVRVVGRVEKKEEVKAIESRKINRRKDRETEKREYKL